MVPHAKAVGEKVSFGQLAVRWVMHHPLCQHQVSRKSFSLAQDKIWYYYFDNSDKLRSPANHGQKSQAAAFKNLFGCFPFPLPSSSTLFDVINQGMIFVLVKNKLPGGNQVEKELLISS